MLKFVTRLDCTVRLLILGLLFLLIPIPAASAEEDTTASQGEEEEEYYVVYYLTDDCEVDQGETGHGQSPERPHEVYIDLLASDPQYYDCQWVRLQGYFSSTNYYHYKGRMYDSILTAFVGQEKIYVEDFGDSDISKFDVEGATIDITGQFIDLCKHANDYIEGMNVLFLFGPCHYGAAYTIKNVTYHGQLSPPHQDLREEFAKSLTTASEVPSDWEHLDEVRAATADWYSLVVEGGANAYEERFPPDDEDFASEEGATQDMNNWVTYFFGSENSPLRRLKPFDVPDSWKIFVVDYPSDDQTEPEFSEVHSCFCLEEQCDGKWPTYSYQIVLNSPSLICIPVRNWSSDETWEWEWF